MSDRAGKSSQARHFSASGKGEVRIPQPTIDVPKPDQEPVLTLRLKYLPDNGAAGHRFFVPYWDATKAHFIDGTLDIRVPKGLTRFHMQLDDTINWAFRDDGDAMTLSGDVPEAQRAYYPRLKNVDATHFWFDALPIDLPAEAPAFRHGFNLYVDLFQPDGARPIRLKIDPDIINPGDHHIIGPRIR